MRITPAEVRTTALMARLALDEGEIGRMAEELDRILEYASMLEEVDTEGVEPTAHAVPLPCPLREDLPGPHLSVEEALGNAPSREDGHFRVPPVLSRNEV